MYRCPWISSGNDDEERYEDEIYIEYDEDDDFDRHVLDPNYD